MSDREIVLSIERDLTSLVEVNQIHWDQKDLRDVLDNLEYGQWDLALELIAAIIVECKTPINQNSLNAVNNLAFRLNLLQSSYIHDFNVYAKSANLEDKT